MNYKLKERFGFLRRGGMSKENLIVFSLTLVIILGIVSLPYFWYCFSFKMERELKRISLEENMKSVKKIDPADFQKINDFFRERAEKYQKSSHLKLPEIF